MANKDKRAQDLKTTWEYPYNQVTQTLGGHEVHFNSTPGKESWRNFTPGGTYTEVDATGREIHFTADNKFTVHSNGHSQTNEGVHDNLVLGGLRDSNLGDFHHEIGGDHTKGLHGQYIKAIYGTGFNYTRDNYEIGSEGKILGDANMGGMAFNSLQGVMMSALTSQYNMVQGDFGKFISGSGDIKANQNIRIAADQKAVVYSKQQVNIGYNEKSTANTQTINISATQTITLSVGQSSIKIESGQITITSPQINFKKG